MPATPVPYSAGANLYLGKIMQSSNKESSKWMADLRLMAEIPFGTHQSRHPWSLTSSGFGRLGCTVCPAKPFVLDGGVLGSTKRPTDHWMLGSEVYRIDDWGRHPSHHSRLVVYLCCFFLGWKNISQVVFFHDFLSIKTVATSWQGEWLWKTIGKKTGQLQIPKKHPQNDGNIGGYLWDAGMQLLKFVMDQVVEIEQLCCRKRIGRTDDAKTRTSLCLEGS